MRFSQLPIGQRFEFEGIRYVKTGPMLAAEEAGGKSRFIGKYVLVQPLGGAEKAESAAVATSQAVDAAAITAAIEEFYREARAIIDRLGADADAATRSRARSELDAARAACVAAVTRASS